MQQQHLYIYLPYLKCLIYEGLMAQYKPPLENHTVFTLTVKERKLPCVIYISSFKVDQPWQESSDADLGAVDSANQLPTSEAAGQHLVVVSV